MTVVLKSSLSWIDNNKDTRDKVLGLLSQFNEKESRDELGIGSIRDSIADQFFPGTSTIQTRLRYFFFIPWLYQEAEKNIFSEDQALKTVDELERSLIETLMKSNDLDGMFGKTSGKSLKRLPSSVYWSGLERWGINQHGCSQNDYFKYANELNGYRNKVHKDIENLKKHNEDPLELVLEKNKASIWHRGLPKPPKDFLQQVNFKLTQAEATFIIDRLRDSCSYSLLSYLTITDGYEDIDVPWEHSKFEEFDSRIQLLLAHAEFFSQIIHGAYLVYNLLLANLIQDKELIDNYENKLSNWYQKLQDRDSKTFSLDNWSLNDFWLMVERRDMSLDLEPIRINGLTKKFVETWLNILREKNPNFYKLNEVNVLIREREKHLKGARSRFGNKKALEQWGGASGISELRYRWATAKQFLKDLSLAREV